MNKCDFLAELRDRISTLPEKDIAESIAFWSEMIDDRMEDGMSEEDAVRAVGTPAGAAAQILGEVPGVKSPVKVKRHTWEIVLLILGSPVWLSLLIAAFAVVLSVYISVWAVVISLWASAFAVTVTAPVSLVYGISCLIGADVSGGFLYIGAAFAIVGIGLFLFALSLWITKAICKLTARLLRRKNAPLKKEKGL